MDWFRRAAPASTRALLARTALQIIVFWGIFLFVVPPMIARLEGAPAMARATYARPLAMVVFAVASALGLTSAFTMVTRGLGTPLPLDGPRHLVVTGPYGVVRNPMAVAGLAQGAAVALWLGSLLVLVYVAAGGVLWHILVRPIEEGDLLATFGDEYRDYRRRVPLWLPRLSSRAPHGPGA